VARKLVDQRLLELGSLVRAQRNRRRLSRKDLASLSGVGASTIQLIENGGTRPKVDTLLLLARGLATDDDGNVNQLVLDELYSTFMSTAGYQPQEAETEGEPKPLTWADLRRELIRLTGRRDVTFAFADVFSNYRSLTPAHQQALEAAAMAALESLRLQEEAAQARRERQVRDDE
jgi:transcriptional regulator with XRE-family HTH domain